MKEGIIINKFPFELIENNKEQVIINDYETDFFTIKTHYIPKRKTPVFHLVNKGGWLIGVIKWYVPWRKYCFFPEQSTIWDTKCLSEVSKFLDKLNKATKKAFRRENI